MFCLETTSAKSSLKTRDHQEWCCFVDTIWNLPLYFFVGENLSCFVGIAYTININIYFMGVVLFTLAPALT